MDLKDEEDGSDKLHLSIQIEKIERIKMEKITMKSRNDRKLA